MKSPLVALWAIAIGFVGGCLFWRNRKRYRQKSWLWAVGKSAFEMAILFATAAISPALLIVWLVCWLTRPMKRPWIKAVVGITAGAMFGFLSTFAIEALVFFGIFAIDMKTGEHERSGFLNCLRRAKDEQNAQTTQAA